MLDRLPDGVLLELIKQFPVLGLVNRRLFGLAELASRNRLLNFYDFRDEQIDGLAADVRELLHMESWHTVEEVAQYDIWFFGPEHVKNFTDTVPLSPGKRSWRLLEGSSWGGSLYMLNWSNNYLEYSTKLRAGRYDLYLEFIGKPADICKMQFHVVNSPQVKQKFASLPPAAWIDRQAMLQPENIDDLSPTQFYVGLMDVEGTESSPWSNVTLRIECVDWSTPLEGLVLNYLYFEMHPSHGSAQLDWVMRSSSNLRPSPAWPEIYRRANARKRRWDYINPGTERRDSSPVDSSQAGVAA